MQIRTLRADEISVRAQSVRENGGIFLLYKDARCDMRILDETFGIYGWQRSHELINGNLFCTVSIWDNEKQQWVSKQDVGVESNTEKEKGEASDSFKRACVNLGIGIELYSSPFIWIKFNAGEFKDNRLSPSVKFHVAEIGYNKDKEIIKLVIKDGDGNIRYKYSAVNQSVDISPILTQIEACVSVEDLQAIWNSNLDYQSNSAFKTAITNKKKQINGTTN